MGHRLHVGRLEAVRGQGGLRLLPGLVLRPVDVRHHGPGRRPVPVGPPERLRGENAGARQHGSGWHDALGLRQHAAGGARALRRVRLADIGGAAGRGCLHPCQRASFRGCERRRGRRGRCGRPAPGVHGPSAHAKGAAHLHRHVLPLGRRGRGGGGGLQQAAGRAVRHLHVAAAGRPQRARGPRGGAGAGAPGGLRAPGVPDRHTHERAAAVHGGGLLLLCGRLLLDAPDRPGVRGRRHDLRVRPRAAAGGDRPARLVHSIVCDGVFVRGDVRGRVRAAGRHGRLRARAASALGGLMLASPSSS
mmetsp:Transcript_9149/g.24301  ORF Transcript_9149/g.24301 Transcript_9149/m.24301 type:complete len:304 (-) Transcript_9149:20-931(-)